jgi:hypothetical protein
MNTLADRLHRIAKRDADKECNGAPKIIRDTVLNALFRHAVWCGDGWRQWFYPNLPRNYDVNPRVGELIERGIAEGSNAEDISRLIIRWGRSEVAILGRS